MKLFTPLKVIGVVDDQEPESIVQPAGKVTHNASAPLRIAGASVFT
jgi:hypothetical protein